MLIVFRKLHFFPTAYQYQDYLEDYLYLNKSVMSLNLISSDQ